MPDEEWIVRGTVRRGGSHNQLILVDEDLPQIPALDLRDVLKVRCHVYGDDEAEAEVSVLPEAHFDEDGLVQPIGFELVRGQLFVTVYCIAGWPDGGDEADVVESVRRLVAPLLAANRCNLELIEADDWSSGPIDIGVRMRIAVPWRGKTVGDLYRVAGDVLELCNVFASGELTRETVGDVVRGGAAHLLVDQPEGNWLDAKAEEYDLASTKGKVSLAQAVARFANAEDGGLIVIGAKAKKVPGGEIIRQVKGVAPRQADTVARYQRVLDQHLYPPVFGLRVDVVPTSDELALILLDIPPQPEELKPFLVHGAIMVTGDTEGSFISIVQRRGEGSIPITAPMIHASLAAGRALLRGTSGRDREA